MRTTNVYLHSPFCTGPGRARAEDANTRLLSLVPSSFCVVDITRKGTILTIDRLQTRRLALSNARIEGAIPKVTGAFQFTLGCKLIACMLVALIKDDHIDSEALRTSLERSKVPESTTCIYRSQQRLHT